MSPISLNLVVLRSRDIDRAAEFYRCLGLEFTRHRHGIGPKHFAAEVTGGDLKFIHWLPMVLRPPGPGSDLAFLRPTMRLPRPVLSSSDCFSSQRICLGISRGRERSGRTPDRTCAAVTAFGWGLISTWRKPVHLTRRPAQ